MASFMFFIIPKLDGILEGETYSDRNTKPKTTPEWEQDTAGQLARVVLAVKRHHNDTSNVELKNLAASLLTLLLVSST